MNLPLLPYSADSVALNVAQAALVALPAAGLPAWLRGYANRMWSLIVPGSIVVVVALLSVLPGAADGLTWFALVAVPIGAALALGWAMRGARPWAALLAAALLVVALAQIDTRAGQLAALLLTALSCVTVGRLLAGAAPASWLRAGLVAMAVIDAVLVFSNGIDKANTALIVAAPGPGLPQLQYVGSGGASMGYGDVFVAGVLGALLAAEGASWRRQLGAAAATFALACAFDILFAVTDTLPATVPVAVVALLVRRR